MNESPALTNDAPRPPAPRARSLRLQAAVLGVVLAVAGLSLVALRLARPAPPLPIVGEVPAFSMRDQRERAVTERSLRGAVSVVDFFFTSCPVACPRLTGRMAELGKQLAARGGEARSRVRLVSITVDPETDTPAKLMEYARRYQADDDRWWFLTGEVGQLSRVVVDGFKVSYQKADPAMGINEIMHGNWFVLVDAGGRIRGYYLSDEADRLRDLVNDAERLASEKE